MNRSSLIITVCFLYCVSPSRVFSETVVNGYDSLIRYVQVQPIICKQVGGPEANFMGDALSEDYIKRQISRVWIQSGIRVDWLSPVVHENDFCYDGSPGNYYGGAVRPGESHLIGIVDVDGAAAAHPDGEVLNLYFVRIVPGNPILPSNTVAGLSFIDSNGAAITVGSDLVEYEGGRDVVASVVSHEIGHILGLDHPSGTATNLMAVGGTTEQIVASQTSVVFTNDPGYGGVDGWDMLQPIGGQPDFVAWCLHNTVSVATDGDDDGDGIAHVIEYMLGLDANVPDRSAMPAVVPSAAGLTWTFPKNPEAVADGLTYGVEISSNGLAWQDAGSAGPAATLLTDSAAVLSARLNAGGGFGMMRFKANIPPNFIPNTAAGSAVLEPLVQPDSGTRRVCAHPGCCRASVESGLRSRLSE